MLGLWVAVPLLLIACVHDLRSRQIPDWISVVLLVWAAAAPALKMSSTSYAALAGGLGAALGIGLLLFALGAFGGGDVKLLIALGALLGLSGFWSLLYWMAIAGGVLSLIAKLRGQKELAYGPAIAAGLLLHLLSTGGLSHAVSI